MELLSNLLWAAVALALWAAWLSQRRRTAGVSLRCGAASQIISLVVLTFILLPVISISDDLQASHNPAEFERTSFRNDQHLARPEAPPPVPTALAAIICCLVPVAPRTFALPQVPSLLSSEQSGQVRVLASRPPPAA